MATTEMPETDVPETELPETGTSEPRGKRRGLRIDAAWMVGAGVLSMLIAFWAQKMWHMKVHVPLYPGGDTTYTTMVIRSVLDYGWLGHNPAIGAPYGSSMYDSVVNFGDATELLIIKVMGFFTNDAPAVLNGMYVFGFALTAGTAFTIFRALRFERIVAATCAVLYSTAFYHFFRSEGHLFLGLYFSVPVACWLILGTMGHVQLFRSRDDRTGRVRRWVTSTTLLTAAGALLVGTSGVYYAAFTMAIIAIIAPLIFIARRTWSSVVAPVLIIGVIAASALAVQLPEIAYHHSHGANSGVVDRNPSASETYGLKIANLVVPPKDHRIGAFAKLGKTYYDETILPTEGASPWLGTAGIIGLVVALLAAVSVAVRPRVVSKRHGALRDAGLASLVTILLGTLGGGSALIAYFVSPEIRGWNRISVFISFFALIGFAALISKGAEWARARSGRAWVGGVLVTVILGLGVLDQTSAGDVPDYAGVLAQWRNDGRYTAKIEHTLPKGSMVLQLPYVPFPENGPVNGMADYDHMVFYIHSKTGSLRWSYGAIKGRLPEDWASGATALTNRDELVAAAAAGFGGVHYDLAGYPDQGKKILADAEAFFGRKPDIVSTTGRTVFWDLRPLAAQEATVQPPAVIKEAASELVKPSVSASWGTGFFPEESGQGHHWYWSQSASTINLANNTGKPATLAISFSLTTPGSGSTVNLTLPGNIKTSIKTRAAGLPPVQFSKSVVVPPGASAINLTTDAPKETADPRDLHVQVVDPEIAAPAISKLASALPFHK